MVETLKSPEINTKGTPVIEFYSGEEGGKGGKVRILDVVLDVLPLPDDVNARRFIPSKSMIDYACFDGPTATLIRDMAIRLNGGISSRNEGPTGVSKSFAAEVICALTNRSYLRHNYSKDSDPGDTIGRFVPSDTKLAIRFEELLQDPGLPESAKLIIENAKNENRSLTVYESKKVAKQIGIDLKNDNQWRWKNGTLTGAMEYGSVFGADEVNLAPGNVVERENSAIEKRPLLRLVEHEGEVIRPLTAAEQSIIDKGGIIPGVIGLNRNYWYCAAQNPYGIGGGRFEESEARRNRLQDRIVEALTPTEYEEFLTFLIKGKQPDIVWQNKHYKGAQGTSSQYRDLENMSNPDVFIHWLAGFQDDLQKLTEKGKIGVEKDIKGGSYIYTRRNLIRFLDSIKGAQKSLLDTNELFKSGKLVYNSNWHDLVMEAVYQEYLAGMYKDDAEVVKELIKASGIEDYLGSSQNNPKPPKWIEDARKKGLEVEAGQGTWKIKKTNLTNIGISISEFIKSVASGGYEAVEGEDIIVKRPLKSIVEIFPQQKLIQQKKEKINKPEK
jgi:hypothetical protein